ncbi:hypothetical protein MSG28_014177 [Choristoneura fumiferana]|uniref:Uncharacterized protein n=1 Tax=Choristoneura fumiferana TaxID=7141 RepID=A0ACC0JG56_CHOFU|nr:hypothetical protein MSG28_014177 [Choristoneura fumiferana]
MMELLFGTALVNSWVVFNMQREIKMPKKIFLESVIEGFTKKPTSNGVVAKFGLPVHWGGARQQSGERVQNPPIEIHKICAPLLRTRSGKWKWAGHICRRFDGRWGKKLLEWRPRKGFRNVGRQPAKWTDDLVRVAGKDWMRKTHDRTEWSKMEETFTQNWVEQG